jgi:hypothetical protein
MTDHGGRIEVPGLALCGPRAEFESEFGRVQRDLAYDAHLKSLSTGTAHWAKGPCRDNLMCRQGFRRKPCLPLLSCLDFFSKFSDPTLTATTLRETNPAPREVTGRWKMDCLTDKKYSVLGRNF